MNTALRSYCSNPVIRFSIFFKLRLKVGRDRPSYSKYVFWLSRTTFRCSVQLCPILESSKPEEGFERREASDPAKALQYFRYRYLVENCEAVLRTRIRIRIRRFRMFLGLLDPDRDPLVSGMDPDPDPSITKQK
jgi:hypothetical protein